MRRFVVGLLLLVVSIGIAWADRPHARRSSQIQHDGLKQYYEIANFRLGGKYDLADPSKWKKDTGHFIRTDNPVDVVDFVIKGTVETSSPLATDRMIRGAVASALPVTLAPAGASPIAGLNK